MLQKVPRHTNPLPAWYSVTIDSVPSNVVAVGRVTVRKVRTRTHGHRITAMEVDGCAPARTGTE